MACWEILLQDLPTLFEPPIERVARISSIVGQNMCRTEKLSDFFLGVAGPFLGLIASGNPADSLSLSLFHWLYIKSTHSVDNLCPVAARDSRPVSPMV